MLSQAAIINGWSKRLEDIASVIPAQQYTTWKPATSWSVPVPTDDPYSRCNWLLIKAVDEATIFVASGCAGLNVADPNEIAEALVLAPGESMILSTGLLVRFSDVSSIVHHFVTQDKEPADLQIPNNLEAWHSKGFCLLKEVINPTLVATLKSALDEALADDVAAIGSDKLIELGQLGALRNLPDLHPVFLDLLGENKVFSFLDTVLRRNYILHAYDGLILGEGEGRFPWDFHTDIESIRGVAFPRGHVPAVNVLYYIDDVSEANGATRLVPYSHTTLIVSPEENALAQLSIAANGKAGDALVFDARLWHCAGNNHSPGSRRLIKMMVTEPWIKQMMDYSRAIAPHKLDQLTPRVRGLLGENSRPPVSTREFREKRR